VSELDIVDRLKELEPERTRNSEFGPMIYAEAAETIVFLRRLIGELEERVAEDDARWNSLTIRASPTPTNDGEAAAVRIAGALWPDSDWEKHLRPEDREHCRKLALAALNQGAGQ
jgi:hypothetical protein